jgi:UDPglucose 6-dehydrogenase
VPKTNHLPYSTPRRIAIVGCGHVGLVMAAGFAHLGHRVIGLDRDPALVEELERGDLRIHERDLPGIIAEGRESRRLTFTTSYSTAVADAEFVFLAVDTPSTPAGAADLRNLRAAAGSVASSVDEHAPIVVNKSTSPVGTGDLLEQLMAERRNGHGPVRVVANPEFLRQGRAVEDFFRPDRVVVGAPSEADALEVAALYEGLGGELVVTSRRTAEMIKYVANAFLATRISFINEVAQLCEAMGVDVDDVVAGVAQDERIGSHFFAAGIGFGGSCLPKDTAALRFMGDTLGVSTPLLSAIQHVNATQQPRAVRRIREALGGLHGKRLAVWGLTFKGGTEDLRQSPAMDVVSLLENEGAEIVAYDPSQPAVLPASLGTDLAPTALDAVEGADALAVLSDWSEFRRVPLAGVRERMRGDFIFDGRNLLDPEAVRALGFRYTGVGRGRAARRPSVGLELVAGTAPVGKRRASIA